MTLGEKQELFMELLPKLLTRAQHLGIKLRGGELYRPKEMAEIYAERGIGIKNSLHCLKLAIDLNFFINGEFITNSDHPLIKDLGVYWTSLHELCNWGGYFRNRDGGHFSITHGGVK